MAGIKDFFSHKRTWALIIALVLQAIAPILHIAMNNPNILYISENLPYLLAALWTALVLGQAYEDRVSKMATSALTATRDPSREEGGWKYALLQLVASDAFVATLFGTILAIVALCIPLHPSLDHLKDVFANLAQLITGICAALTISLKYSAAHADVPGLE